MRDWIKAILLHKRRLDLINTIKYKLLEDAKKIIPALSRCIKSRILVVILFTYVWLPITIKAGDMLLDKVIATVNQEQILHSDLEEACKQLALEGKIVNASVKMNILRQLVLNKIFLSKAILDYIKFPKAYLAYIQRECDFKIASLIQRLVSEEKLVQAVHQSIYHIKKAMQKSKKEEYLISQVYQHLTEHVRRQR